MKSRKRKKSQGEMLYMDQVTKGLKMTIELVNVENINDADESRISRVDRTEVSLKEKEQLCFY